MWAGGAAAIISLGTLVGWGLDLPVLTRGVASGLPLNPMAGLAGLLVGLALLCHERQPDSRLRRAGLALAAAGTLIPLARIVELVSQGPAATDRLLFPSRIPGGPADGPGRFLASHAVLFLLVGGAALLVQRRSEYARLISRTIGIVLAALLGIALLGLISRAMAGTTAASSTPPAMTLSVVLLVLCLGVIGASEEPRGAPDTATIGVLRRRMTVALCGAFGILVLATGISLWSAYRSQEAARQRGQARATALALAGVLDALYEAESAERGYLLTRDATHLRRFAAARDSFPARADRLASLAAANPIQARRFAGLQATIAERLASLTRAIGLEGAGQHDQALALIRSGSDQGLVEQIRTEATRLASQSDSIARRWDERLQSGGRISVLFNLAAGIFALVFLAMAGVAFNRDLDRRAGVEAALAASERRLSQLVTLLPDSVVLKEPSELRYVLVNWAGTNSLGFATEELLGKTAFDVLPEEEARRITEEDRRALSSSGVLDLPDQVVHSPRLGRRIIHSKKVAMRDDQGVPVYLLTVTEDVTERKQAEEAIRAARDAAEAANRAKSVFLAKMSHELRTPLNSIIGFSEILEDGGAGPLNQKQQRYVGNVLLSGRNLLQLINDILDLSKVEAGRVELAVSTFPVEPVVEEVRTVVETMAARKHLTVSIAVEPGTPLLKADRGRISQVLTNLAGNAVKFTPEGGRIDIGARRAGPSERRPEESVEFWVRDTGVGIAPEDQERIFREFEQVGTGSPGEREGTGLGLSLAKRLVELHGGWMAVESAVGEGSTFRFAIPVESRGGQAVPIRSRAGGEPPPGNGPLVLVVDDEPNARDLLAHHLEQAGYRVIVAGAGEEALALASRFRPDAITLDILMPDQDGFEILAHLKSAEATRTIPVVVVSVVDTRELGLTLGADDWLVKPVQRDALLAALRRVLGPIPPRPDCRILIVDDDPATLEYLSRTLTHQGFNVHLADGGVRGLGLARQERPDLIILDLIMPDLNGFEVVRNLRADEATRQIPILILTAKDLSIEERDRLRHSVQAIITKGGEGALLAELHRLVARSQAAG